MKSYRIIFLIIFICACSQIATYGSTRTLPQTGIKAVEASPGVRILYAVGPDKPVVLSGSDYALEVFEASVSDGVLRILSKTDPNEINMEEEDFLEVTISAPNISKFKIGRESRLVCSGKLILDRPFELELGSNSSALFADIQAANINLNLSSHTITALGNIYTDGDFTLHAKEFTIIEANEIKAAGVVKSFQNHNSIFTVKGVLTSGEGGATLGNRAQFSATSWTSIGTVSLHAADSAIINIEFTSGTSLKINLGAKGIAHIADCTNRTIYAEGSSGSLIHLCNINADSIMAKTDKGQIVLTGQAKFGAITSDNGIIPQKNFKIVTN